LIYSPSFASMALTNSIEVLLTLRAVEISATN
jgi:hypothetical protein